MQLRIFLSIENIKNMREVEKEYNWNFMNRKIDIDFTDPNHIFLAFSYEVHSINQELIDNEAIENLNISKHVQKIKN